jgi:hypothetical protein
MSGWIVAAIPFPWQRERCANASRVALGAFLCGFALTGLHAAHAWSAVAGDLEKHETIVTAASSTCRSTNPDARGFSSKSMRSERPCPNCVPQPALAWYDDEHA